MRLSLACAALLAFASGASAAIVHRTVNLPIPANQYGLWLNVETGDFTTTVNGPSGWDFNVYTSGGYSSGPAAGGANIVLYTGSSNGAGFMRYPGTVSGTPPKLPADATVAAYGSFGAGLATFGAQEGAWKLNADNVVGFRFRGADSQVRFGWARIAVGATSTTRTLVDYAFESEPGVCIAVGQAAGGPPSDCAAPAPYAPCTDDRFRCSLGDNLPILNVTTTQALQIPASACGGAPLVLNRANWYPFDVPVTGAYTVSLCGTATDTRLAVLEACDPAAAVRACNEDYCASSAAVSFPASAGERLWIVAGLADPLAATAAFLPVTIAPPYEPCAQAAVVPTGASVVAANGTVPSLDLTGHCSMGTVYDSVIYKANYVRWTASADGYYRFGACGQYHAKVAVLSQCGDPSSVIACSYDQCAATQGATVGFWATAGVAYSLAFGVSEPYWTLPASVNLDVSPAAPPPDPCGADLGTAVLGMQSVRLDMDFPDLSMAGTPCSFANGQAKLYYPTFLRFVPPVTGLYSIGNCTDTDPNSWGIYDLRLAVMSSCGEVASLLACDDNGCSGDVPPWTSRISGLALTGGTPVYIAVAGGDVAAPGPFALEISLDSAAPCPADLDGDGTVSGADLGVLLGDWGTGGSIADLDGDGTVSGADLSVLLGEWGPC